MSPSLLLPTAPTTLVIVLGASAWPNSPGFQPSEAFVHAAQGFREYVLDPHGLGLPPMNLLDLFDSQTSASDQLETLSSFLKERIQTQKATNQAARDVLLYFVGHGGFVGPAADFYLLHRRANASSLRATGMAIDALAEVVREQARQARRYLFLDCCFAAAAFQAFQAGPDQIAITKALDAFQVQARSRGFPQRGTVLFCSSNQKTPSQLLPDESSTMFSAALLDVLKNGDLSRSLQLTLRDLKELVEDRLARLPGQNAPRPGLYSPDQSEGDVADVPFFFNQAAREEEHRKTAEEKRQRAEEERIQQALQEAKARKATEEESIRRLEEEARALQSKLLRTSSTEGENGQSDQMARSLDPSPLPSGARTLLEQPPLAPAPAPKPGGLGGKAPASSPVQGQSRRISRALVFRPGVVNGLGYGLVAGGLSVAIRVYIASFTLSLGDSDTPQLTQIAVFILSLVTGILSSRASGSLLSSTIAGGMFALWALAGYIFAGPFNSDVLIPSNINFLIYGIVPFLISVLSGLLGRYLYKRRHAIQQEKATGQSE